MKKNFLAALLLLASSNDVTHICAQAYSLYETPAQIEDRNNRNRVFDFVITPTSEKGVFVVDTNAVPSKENHSPHGCFGVSAEIMEKLLSERYVEKDELIFFTESYSAHVRARVIFNGLFKKPTLHIRRDLYDHDYQLQLDAFHGFELLEKLFHEKKFYENKRRPGLWVEGYHDAPDVMLIRYHIPELSHEVEDEDEDKIVHYEHVLHKGGRTVSQKYDGPRSRCPKDLLEACEHWPSNA